MGELVDAYLNLRGTAVGPEPSGRETYIESQRPRVPMRPSPRMPPPRQQSYEQVRRQREIESQLAPREAMNQRNQFAEAGQMAWEMTGYPSIRRSGEAFRAGDYGDAAYEGVWGAMGVGGLASLPALAGRGAPAPRPAPAMRPPTPPPRQIGPNGMPIAPRRPFRNSLRGGSDDLAEAAGMRSGPDAGPRGGGRVDAEGNLRDEFGRRIYPEPEPFDAARIAQWQTTQNRAGRAGMLRDERNEARIARLPREPMAPGSNRYAGIDRLQLDEGVQRYTLTGPEGTSGRLDIAADGTIGFYAPEALLGADVAASRTFYERALAAVFDDARRTGRPIYRFSGGPNRRDRIDAALLRAAERRGELPDGYGIAMAEDGAPSLVRVSSAPDGGQAGVGQRLYHGTTRDIDEFAPGSHFGTREAANQRLADNAPGAEGQRIYAIDEPPGAYASIPDIGDFSRGAHWADMARTRSPATNAEEALLRALRNDADLPNLNGEALYARLEQHFRDAGLTGARYRNRWEGGESVFMPGRVPMRPPPDGAKSNRPGRRKPAFFLPRTR